MKDLIIPANAEALSRAQIAIVGEDTTRLIMEAYKLIDSAMVFGYQKSQEDEAEGRKKLAEEYIAAQQAYEARDTSQAFRHGYDEGFEQAGGGEDIPAAQQESYDDGYVDGVSDARAFPRFADDQVALLCAGDEFYDREDYIYEEDVLDHEYMYEGDSGDENDMTCIQTLCDIRG